MNFRHIIQKSMLAMMAALTMSSCDMMTEDLSDCPTGLYVNFVYDYNIQRADMFKDHVGGVALFVYDESDRLVAQRQVSGSELKVYGYCIHFTEEELAPGHLYRLTAVAMQKDWNQASPTTGYQLSADDDRQSLSLTLAHQHGRPYGYVSDEAPLDTLWHTLTILDATAANIPAATRYHMNNLGEVSTNGSDVVALSKGIPTYATVSLVRDTKHLNLSLRELDTPEAVSHEDYDVTIIDANTELDYMNNLVTPSDSVVYRPYAQWTSVVKSDGQTTADYSAHYDLMFNRLMYNTTTQKNAVLCIRKRPSGEVVALFNLPYILCQGRMAYEIYSYTPQEYLDREYDYRLELFLKNKRWGEGSYLAICVHDLPWVLRLQYVSLN